MSSKARERRTQRKAAAAKIPRGMPNRVYTVLLYIVVAFVAVWLLLPLGLLAWRFVELEVSESLPSPALLRNVLVYTFRIAFVVTLGCLVLGYPVAYFINSVSDRWAVYLLAIVLAPVWINLVVRTYAFLVLLGRRGFVNSALENLGIIDAPLRLNRNEYTVYAGMIQVLLPFMILILVANLRAIDKNLLAAARSLGASEFSVIRRIALPLSMPGIWGGVVLVFAISLGFFVTPALLGRVGDFMIAQLINVQTNRLGNFEEAVTMAIGLTLVTVTLFFLYNRFFGLDRIWGGLAGEISADPEGGETK